MVMGSVASELLGAMRYPQLPCGIKDDGVSTGESLCGRQADDIIFLICNGQEMFCGHVINYPDSW
jgi:hypothetical protein